MLHKLLVIYRKIQYTIFGRLETGIMPKGQRCVVLEQEENETRGDIVHPCVRYIPEGFRGHKWWMVYTPYYGANASIENPRFCWGEECGDDAPVNWHVEDLVKDGYAKGYNSDPNLYYEDGKMFVYWRENDTERLLARGLHRGTFVKVYTVTGVEEYEKPVLVEDKEYEDKETCPTFIKIGNEYLAYGMHLVFKNEKFIGKPFFQKLFVYTDLFGFYSQQKFKGVALWKSDSPIIPYKYEQSVKFTNCNRLYHPWHMDLFQYEGVIYAIVQTNQGNGDICLARSTDGIHFSFYKQPLITNNSCGGIEIYKPTALVVKGKIYVYYTFQSPECEKYNMLYVTSMDFQKLLEKLG